MRPKLQGTHAAQVHALENKDTLALSPLQKMIVFASTSNIKNKTCLEKYSKTHFERLFLSLTIPRYNAMIDPRIWYYRWPCYSRSDFDYSRIRKQGKTATNKGKTHLKPNFDFGYSIGSNFLNLNYSFGFDGISIFFFYLSALLIFSCILFI